MHNFIDITYFTIDIFLCNGFCINSFDDIAVDVTACIQICDNYSFIYALIIFFIFMDTFVNLN